MVENTMAKSMRDIFIDCCHYGSVLGIRYLLIYPDWLSRLFWMISIAVCLTFAGFTASKQWAKYVGQPVRIMITNQFGPINDIDFPAVTFCSPNQITIPNVQHFRSTLTHTNSTERLEMWLLFLFGFIADFPVDINEEDIFGFQRLLEDNRYDLKDLLMTLPQPCKDYVVYCSWEGYEVDCMDIFDPIVTSFGVCCTFNSAYYIDVEEKLTRFDEHFQAFVGYISGAGQGLTVILDNQADIALPGTMVSSGASRILIHGPMQYPNTLDTMLLSPHNNYHQGISAIVTTAAQGLQLLPLEVRECVYSDEVQLTRYKKYSTPDCLTECSELSLERTCHCRLTYNLFGRVCRMQDLPCVFKHRESMRNVTKLAKCNCYLECETLDYEVSSTVGSLQAAKHTSTEFIVCTCVASRNFNFTRNHLLAAVFHMTPFYAQQTRTTVVPLVQFLSSIGGSFGIIFGFSILSLLEIIGFFYLIAKSRIRKRKDEKKLRQIAMLLRRGLKKRIRKKQGERK